MVEEPAPAHADAEEPKPIASTDLNELFGTLPAFRYPQHFKVECLSSPEAINRRLAHLVGQGDTIYGFDMEWQPQFKKGGQENKTALIQICNKDTILLLQVLRLKYLPSELVQFLKAKTLLKSGVNIKGDGNKLARDFKVECNSFVDLDRICAQLYPEKRPRSLRALTGYFLGANMSKKKSIQCSNWSRLALTPAQIQYAASDAYASYKIMTIFQESLVASGSSAAAFAKDIAAPLIPTQHKTKDKKVVIQHQNVSRATVSTAGPTSTTTIIRKSTQSNTTISHTALHSHKTTNRHTSPLRPSVAQNQISTSIKE